MSIPVPSIPSRRLGNQQAGCHPKHQEPLPPIAVPARTPFGPFFHSLVLLPFAVVSSLFIFQFPFPLLSPWFLLLPSPLSPPSLSAPPAFLSPSVIPGHRSLAILCFTLDLRKLEPLLDTDKRTEFLLTGYRAVLCLPPTEGLPEEASDPTQGQASVVRSCRTVLALF